MHWKHIYAKPVKLLVCLVLVLINSILVNSIIHMHLVQSVSVIYIYYMNLDIQIWTLLIN